MPPAVTPAHKDIASCSAIANCNTLLLGLSQSHAPTSSILPMIPELRIASVDMNSRGSFDRSVAILPPTFFVTSEVSTGEELSSLPSCKAVTGDFKLSVLRLTVFLDNLRIMSRACVMSAIDVKSPKFRALCLRPLLLSGLLVRSFV